MKQQDEKIRVLDFLMFTVGTAMYGWGLVNINIPNKLAEGGVAGLTLIIRALTGFNPAYSTLLLNIPLVIIGWRILGKRSLIYTLYGIAILSFWIWLWQRIPLTLNLHHDMFIAGILAGLIAGAGSGLVYRFGGTTGGSDVVARVLEKNFGIPMGKSLLAADVVVLLLSLIYVDVLHMMYTVVASYVFSRVVTITQEGAYAARGVMIMTNKPEEIATAVFTEMNRGASYFKTEGSYTREPRLTVYVVVAPNELHQLRGLIDRIDQRAFTTILNVQETLGEGFTYNRPRKPLLLKKGAAVKHVPVAVKPEDGKHWFRNPFTFSPRWRLVVWTSISFGLIGPRCAGSRIANVNGNSRVALGTLWKAVHQGLQKIPTGCPLQQRYRCWISGCLGTISINIYMKRPTCFG